MYKSFVPCANIKQSCQKINKRSRNKNVRFEKRKEFKNRIETLEQTVKQLQEEVEQLSKQ